MASAATATCSHIKYQTNLPKHFAKSASSAKFQLPQLPHLPHWGKWGKRPLALHIKSVPSLYQVRERMVIGALFNTETVCGHNFKQALQSRRCEQKNRLKHFVVSSNSTIFAKI